MKEIDLQYLSPKPVNPVVIPDKFLTKADYVINLVETVECILNEELRKTLGTGMKIKKVAVITNICKKHFNVRLATYYKYVKIYTRYNGDQTRIAASFRRSTLGKIRFGGSVLHLTDTLILRYYARSRPRLQPQEIYNVAQSVIRRTGGQWIDPQKCGGDVPQNLVDELLNDKIPMNIILENQEKFTLLTQVELPSRTWFYQYLHWFTEQPNHGKTIIDNRYGKGAWDRELMVFDTFVTRAQYPLQFVFADHWLVDIFTVDDETRSKINRLWLTVLIDAYSRCPIGLALLYESPCIESIQSALKNAIWPKTYLKELDLSQEWSCFGIPIQLSLDNAWAHHSHSVESLARTISQNGKFNSIDLVFRPPYMGRYGALIERMFGNLSAKIKRWYSGGIMSSDHKHIANAAKEARLLYQDVYLIIHKIILEYLHTPHRELMGLTPHQKWMDGISKSGPPFVPPLTTDIDRLFWRMSPETRQISSKPKFRTLKSE